MYENAEAQLRAKQQAALQADQAQESYIGKQPTVRQCLVAKFQRSSAEARRADRVISILSKHPEFEEMLELLGLLNLVPNSNGEVLVS